MSVLENLLHHTPKQEAKAKEYHTLPVIKVLFDWLHTDRDLVGREAFKNSSYVYRIVQFNIFMVNLILSIIIIILFTAQFYYFRIWPNLSKLLNNLQFHNGQKDISWELEKCKIFYSLKEVVLS